MDPITLSLILAGVTAAGKGISGAIGAAKEKKFAKKKALEMHKQNLSDLFHSALERDVEHRKNARETSSNLSRGLAANARDSSSVVRGALRL